MSESTHMTVRKEEKIPTALLRGILVLLAFVLTLVFYARITDRPLVAQPPDGAIVAERIIYLQGTPTGAARILDANGDEIIRYATGDGGFVSTIDRVIRRESFAIALQVLFQLRPLLKQFPNPFRRIKLRV